MDLIQIADLDEIKTAFGVTGTTSDDQLALCIADVTAEAAEYCKRSWDYAELIEFPEIRGTEIDGIQLARPPIISVTSLHVSKDLPRVYDETTLLVEDTDFFVDAERGWVEFADAVTFCGKPNKSIRVEYSGGYESTEDVPRAIRSLVKGPISRKWNKLKNKQYHLVSESIGEGSVTGIRFVDWEAGELEQLRAFCLGVRGGAPIGVA